MTRSDRLAVLKDNPEVYEDSNNISSLLSLVKIKGEYYIWHKADEGLSSRTKIWEVAISRKKDKSQPCVGIPLEKNLEIKLGRLHFYVRDLSSDEDNERS